MLACAKAQSGIKNDNGLIFLRFAFAPTRFDEQRVTDFDWFEMPFPRCRPIFMAHLRDRDFAGADFQSAVFNPLQSGRNFFAGIL